MGAAAKDLQGTGATAHEVTFTTPGTSTTPTNTTPTNATPTTRRRPADQHHPHQRDTPTTQTTPTVVKPAFCKKYPKLRTTLARQLKAAKKARVKAATPKVKAKFAKRIKTITKQQKAATKKFKVTCRVGAAAKK